MAEPMSNKELNEILALFQDLPSGRSERNHYLYNQTQAKAIKRLRVKYTPKEMEQVLNISVYRLRKLECWAQSFDHGKQIDRSKGYKKKSKAYQWRPVQKPTESVLPNIGEPLINTANQTLTEMASNTQTHIQLNTQMNDQLNAQPNTIIDPHIDAQIDEIIYKAGNITLQ